MWVDLLVGVKWYAKEEGGKRVRGTEREDEKKKVKVRWRKRQRGGDRSRVLGVEVQK